MIFLYPIDENKYRISQPFGANPQDYPKSKVGHPGIDWATPVGVPIRASSDGMIIFAGINADGYGRLIVISHQDSYYTYYAHLSKILVVARQKVMAGDIIGATGGAKSDPHAGNTTGAHLHFEIVKGTIPINPLSLLKLSKEYATIAVGEVLVDELRVRSVPTTIQNSPIGKIKKGEIVPILDVEGTEVWLRTPRGFIAAIYNGERFVLLKPKQ